MKKIFKVNQYIGQKIGYITGSVDDLDNQEKKFENVAKTFNKMHEKIEELLQPNVVFKQRLKFADSLGIIKHGSKKYPQVEESISQVLLQNGKLIGGDFGNACEMMGQAFMSLSQNKDELEIQICNNTLLKIAEIKKNKIHPMQKYLKKLKSARLEYDSIKNKKDMSKAINDAKTRYSSIKTTCYYLLADFLDDCEKNNIELMEEFCQILYKFYFKSSLDSKEISDKLSFKISQLPERHKSNDFLYNEYTEKREPTTEFDDTLKSISSVDREGDFNRKNSLDSNESYDSLPKVETEAIVQFDFEGKEEDELTVSAGEKIGIIEKVDDDWFVGLFKGKIGLIPASYIKIDL